MRNRKDRILTLHIYPACTSSEVVAVTASLCLGMTCTLARNRVGFEQNASAAVERRVALQLAIGDMGWCTLSDWPAIPGTTMAIIY